jgi:hypothetical protein
MSAVEDTTNGVDALKCILSLASTDLAPALKYNY